ncbi:MAG: hypothetical protein DLM57_13165 [Pseudonocardiales bacterium]|nr:MAG: hypothetical protein DLM57_13165 [Pseudonocardiales bacterium]
MTALLARHSAAVLSHSAAAFLDDVDTAPAAAGFRQRQQAEIASLAQVPLQSWRYAVSAPVTDPSASAATAKRVGAPVLIVHVSLFYALTLVDPQPTSRDLWWTFVQRDGRVLVAGDDDMAELGGASWTGPWDYGPLVAARGTSSLVLGHPQDSGQLARLAALVDAAVPVVTGVWGTGWVRHVAVLVPASDNELTALAGQGSALTDVSAVTVFDAQDPASGTRYGQRLVLNPHALARLTATGLRIVVAHEITHIASAAGTGQASPRWLIEGLAEYVANLGSTQPVTVAAGELRTEVAAGRLPAALPTDAQFAPGSARLAQVYEESWLACRLIAARVGQSGLVRLYRLVGASPDVAIQALEAALHRVLHESTASFTMQWRGYLTGQLG